jgi:hypothetical protein
MQGTVAQEKKVTFLDVMENVHHLINENIYWKEKY